MDDQRGAAIESNSLGILFDYQGRFGAAIKSEQDALKTFHDLKDQSISMVRILNATAEALILAGRGAEAKDDLDESFKLSRELKSDSVTAQTLGVQGDSFFYAGNFKSAQASYAEALQAAKRSKEPDTVLIANFELAKVLVGEQRSQEALSALKPLLQHADDLGLKYVSVECSILMDEAMIQRHDLTGARDELKRTVLRADQLGMQPLSARAHYLLAITEKDPGSQPEAQQDYREVVRLLDGMKKDPGAEHLLDRADFKAIYEQSTHETAR